MAQNRQILGLLLSENLLVISLKNLQPIWSHCSYLLLIFGLILSVEQLRDADPTLHFVIGVHGYSETPERAELDLPWHQRTRQDCRTALQSKY